MTTPALQHVRLEIDGEPRWPTSVGTAAIDRFLRPVSYQDAPDEVLPPA